MSSPISGFTAIPNPYMIPLLFLQSLLIGAGFGIGYQGERRKLSAMSNEDFNKLDLGMHAFNQFKEILARNDFGKMLDLMHPLTQQLAEAFGQFINNLPQNVASVVNEATGGFNFNIPTGFGGGALVGAPAGSGLTEGSNQQFQTYLKFLQDLNKEGKTFGTPQADERSVVYQYALKWMNPKTGIDSISRMSQGEAKYILQQISKGNLNDFKQWRAPLIKHMDSFNIKPKTQADVIPAIEKSGLSGVNKELAVNISNMKIYLAFLRRAGRTSSAINRNKAAFLMVAKKHNQLAQANRKYSFVVDTLQSLNTKHLVYKRGR